MSELIDHDSPSSRAATADSAQDPTSVSTDRYPALPAYLRRALQDSTIAFDIRYPNGAKESFGHGTPTFHVALRNQRAINAIASLNENRVGDAYVAGDIELDGDMLRLFDFRSMFKDKGPLVYLWRFLEPLLFGQIRTNRRVVSTHYDVDSAFFLSFLDPAAPSYTQGIYADDSDTLEVATLRKFQYCFDALKLRPGQHLLDIGPGWGAFLQYASARGVRCTGITISKESAEYLRKRSAALGYNWNILTADLLEYAPREQYDAIAIMGVMEHLPHYHLVVPQFQRLLKPGGRLFLDASADIKKYEVATFLVKYIYPGNHSYLVLHDFLQHLARSSLRLIDLHNDRHSYYLTARQWAINLEKNREFIEARFGKEKYRAFRLYLWGTAFAFMRGGLDCYRMILWHRTGTDQELATP